MTPFSDIPLSSGDGRNLIKNKHKALEEMFKAEIIHSVARKHILPNNCALGTDLRCFALF